jgi:hypothetical protein
MAQDFAKKSPQKGRKKAPGTRVHAAGRGSESGTSSPLTWFFSGLLCGVFVSGLVWLASLQPEVGEAMSKVTEATLGDGEMPKPRFDFYTLLPQQNIEVEVDSKDIQQARTNKEMDQFLLQAGSFRQSEDADRRRAELILLSLDAKVEETNGDNGRWFRVYIGPFQSRSKLAKARSLTAQQGIDTLLLKKPKPAQR